LSLTHPVQRFLLFLLLLLILLSLQQTDVSKIFFYYPLERLHRKRIGTLENVISDLKRFRDMDTKETENTDNKSTQGIKTDANATNKDSKGL